MSTIGRMASTDVPDLRGTHHGREQRPVVIDKRGQSYRGGVALPSKQEMDRGAIERNVRNLAGATWWHMQGAHQRGDHVEASRHAIARTRVLAEAQRQGLSVGV